MKIHKWGNSLGLRLPKAVAEQAGIGEGTEVEMVMDGDRIVIRRAPVRYELDEMVSLIRESNLHAEIDTGEPEGGEVW